VAQTVAAPADNPFRQDFDENRESCYLKSTILKASMQLKKFAKKFAALRTHEKRSTTDRLLEVVFFTEDETRWAKLFDAEFGPPIKKRGDPLPADEQHWISATGGIWKDQTLYGKIIDGGVAIAKFQPWKDGVHTTLKMMVLKKDAFPK